MSVCDFIYCTKLTISMPIKLVIIRSQDVETHVLFIFLSYSASQQHFPSFLPPSDGNWLQGASPPECKSLISDRKGPKTTDDRVSFVSAMSLHVCRCHLSLVFGMVWRCGEIHNDYKVVRLYHGKILFYWEFLAVDYYEDDSFLNCTVQLIMIIIV